MRFPTKSPRSAVQLKLVARALLLLAILLAYLAGPAKAQPISILFDTLSVENGLSQSTVRAILQDSQGFMWFGTDDGLNKYDGYSFTLYKHDAENPDSLIDNTINAIFEDSRGNLWVGTAGGLERFRPETGTFQHFLSDPKTPGALRGNSISAIAEDSNKAIWIGATDGGLHRLVFGGASGPEISFVYYPHDDHNPASLVSNQVRALLADEKGGLWVGTDSGLDYLPSQNSPFTHYRNDPNDPTSLSDDRVLSLFIDRVGTLWAGTEEGGLNRMNPLVGVFTRYTNRPNNPYSLSSNLVRAIIEDKAGQLWVGGRDGLNLFNRQDEYFSHYQHDPNDPKSLSNDNILSIYTDRSGVLWIGTFGGGLSKYVQNNSRFSLYQHRPNVPNSLSSDVVYSIYEDREGNAWVGTLDGGLNRLDREAGTFSAYKTDPDNPRSISSNDVRAILEDHRGILWIGTNGGGLNRFDSNNQTDGFIHYLHDAHDPASIADNRVTAIFEDRRGNLWIGTRGGLDLLNTDTGKFQHFRSDPTKPFSLADNYVRTMYEDRAGRLWVGTNNGISVLDPNSQYFRRYQNDPKDPLSLSNDRVLSILETEEGVFWVGTLLGGLNRFEPSSQKFYHYTQKQGLPGDSVYGVLADRSGYLWLSTNRGLSRFDPRSGTFRNYDPSDGLQSYEFNPGAYFQNSKGRIYFGGIQGFNAFDPPRVQDNPLPPPVVITAFKIFNQTERENLTGGENINLSYEDKFISFEFAALDYSSPEKNQYAYKLDGFDKDWIYAGTRRYVSYTNLRGGKYTFRVIGSNQDGVWNETGTSIEIDISPPIWERWWFLGSAGLVLFGIAVASYRLRVVRIQSQNKYLEEQIRDRTQEIERRREVAEGLREILAILNSNRTLRESLDAIILQVVRLMNARAVLIFRCGEEQYPEVVASNLYLNGSLNKPRVAGLYALPEWVTQPVLDGKVLTFPDMIQLRSVQPEVGNSPVSDYSALLAQPLVVNDKVDGGLVLLYDWPRTFSEEDRQMAASFANHAALAIANAQLRNQAEEIAVSAERNRLARDLHDAVTQTLFATSLIAEVLPRLWERNPEIGRQKINEIRELTRGALAEMRTLLMELRPTALMDVPLPDLLQQLSEAFTGRARVPVRLELEKTIQMPSNVKIGFYRIVQESLNNIQKHARASQVKISLHECDQRVELSIQDNGIGFDISKTPPDHFGLGIMQERAQSIGAAFNLQSQPGKGTTICVAWEQEQSRTA